MGQLRNYLGKHGSMKFASAGRPNQRGASAGPAPGRVDPKAVAAGVPGCASLPRLASWFQVPTRLGLTHSLYVALTEPRVHQALCGPQAPTPVSPLPQKHSPSWMRRLGTESWGPHATGARARAQPAPPRYRQTHLSAGHLLPASAGTELGRGFPGCPGDATDAGKHMKLSLTFMAPFSLLKCLKP